MARNVQSAVVVRQKYYWPDVQLNIWTIIMLATAGTVLGVSAQFMQIQSVMRLPTPWYVSSFLFSLPFLESKSIQFQFQKSVSYYHFRESWVNHGFDNRIFPYGVTVGALTIFFVILELILIAQRRLLPGVVMLWSFVLLVLFITGIIGTALQLFAGPNISSQCNQFVNNNKIRGPSERTLAWLQQNNICKFFGFFSPHSLSSYSGVFCLGLGDLG